jgi:uncharacterized protein (DUF1330 family)
MKVRVLKQLPAGGYFLSAIDFKTLEGESTMPAYIIAQVTIHDPVEYEKYMAGVGPTFAPFQARVLVAADEVEVFEGSWPRTRTVVLEFPSAEQAKGWYQSPAYQSILQHRLKAANSNLVLAPGFEPPQR